ncbi:MAG: prephenate dehydratase [Veillonellales bacterium]
MKKRFSVIATVTLLILVCSSIAFANVSYLGPAGTYTEEATAIFFGDKETTVPVPTVPEALKLVKTGQSQYAVVPVENTIGGPVYNYLDAVINDAELVVVGEINLPIRQTLLALPGADIKGIKTIMSHPQGLAQSKDWIKANLPEAKLIEVPSTAEAAKRVAEMGDPSAAAIAASRTAAVYNLAVLASDLQYTNTNVTRFWVVTLKKNQTLGSQKATVVLQGPAQELPKVLNNLSRKGFTVISLHDRPAKTKLGEYTYVLELAGSDINVLEKALKNDSNVLQYRITGVFNAK